MNNITEDVSSAYPVRPPSDCFFVTATKDIQTPRRMIEKGSYLLVNPDIQPTDGKMVVVGTNAEVWANQASIQGVVVAVCTDEKL